MTGNITIPPEALEAAKSAYTAAIYRGNGTAREYHEAMRAACLAMLEAWPGMAKPSLPPHPSEHHKGEET